MVSITCSNDRATEEGGEDDHGAPAGRGRPNRNEKEKRLLIQ